MQHQRGSHRFIRLHVEGSNLLQMAVLSSTVAIPQLPDRTLPTDPLQAVKFTTSVISGITVQTVWEDLTHLLCWKDVSIVCDQQLIVHCFNQCCSASWWISEIPVMRFVPGKV